MKTLQVAILLAAALAAFMAGDSYRADRIKANCDSDDTPLVIHGTPYVCLSPRHVEILQRQRSNWRGA